MSRDRFSDHCPGCRPAILDATTGQVMGDDTPEMIAVMKAWARTTYKQREVFHRVTCQNSRLPSDLRIFKQITAIIQRAIDPEATGGDAGELVEIPISGERAETLH